MRLSKEKITEIINSFQDYKYNNKFTTYKIAQSYKVDRTTIENYYKKFFEKEYKEVSKLKRSKPKIFTQEIKQKISKALKNKQKPSRTEEHKRKLSLAFKGKSFKDRFGEEKALAIREKISKSNKGKKRRARDENWRRNLSNSLKGRKVWNKGKKTGQIPWNKKELPIQEILSMYLDKNLSSIKIAKHFNVDKSTILKILKEESVQIKGFGGFYKGKKLNEILGEEKAKIKNEKASKKNKGRKCTWKDKISQSIKKFYEECRNKNYKLYRNRKALSPEQRLKLSLAHKKYLKEHPEELERLRKIQYPGKITKVEQKMLNFLKENFIEGADFYFDKQDSTGKTFYRPDFQFPKNNIIIEIDGYYKHFTKEGYKKDKIREYYLKKAGWKIFRFSFYDIDRNYKFEEVKNNIKEILKHADFRN